MRTKESDLFDRLSESEQSSLRKLCRCSCYNQKIPVEHAEKLLSLGLAELTCGGLGPTCAGRHAVSHLMAD